VAAGGGLHALAASNFRLYDKEFQELPCAQGAHPLGCTEHDVAPDLDAVLNRARRQQTIATGIYIAGGSVIAASVVLLYLNRPRLTEREVAESLAASTMVFPAVSGDMLGIYVNVNH
jgi:hypothetical protein